MFFGVVCFKAWRLNRKLRSMRREADTDGCISGGARISVWQIDGIGQPFVWGLLRGSVYVPGNFDKCGNAEDRRGILMHEFAHVRRFDAGVNVLQIIAQGIFWFHPFVWAANTMVRREREKCCDEAAIAGLESAPRDYGKAIVDTLTREYASNMPAGSLAIAGPVKNIEDRIKTIMRPGKKFYSRCGVFALLTILLLAVVAVPTGLVLTAKAESSGTDFEQEFYKNWRANRAKLSSASLAWKWNANWHVDGLVGLSGDNKMHWDGRYSVTNYSGDILDYTPAGKVVVTKGEGSNTDKVRSNKPAFGIFENWLISVGWRGGFPLDDYIRSFIVMEHLVCNWSIVTTEQGEMLELIIRGDGKHPAFKKEGHTRRLFDINRGYCFVSKETFHGETLRNQEKARVAEVAPGCWFPVKISRKSFDANGNVERESKLALDLSRCRFNDKSAKPDGIFDKRVRDEQKSLDGLLKETSARLKIRGGFHKEIQKAVAAFLTASAAGDTDKAAGYTERMSVGTIKDMRELLGSETVGIDAVYADPSAGLVISSAIQADHGRVGALVFTVRKVEGKWLINDIDVESAEGAEEEIKRFGAKRKDAILVRFEGKAKDTPKAGALMFYGLDLSKAAITAKFFEITDLFEARPAGSKSYHFRDNVEKVYLGLDGAVYYVPDKNVFYVQHDLLGSSSFHYYGPFEGDPRKVLKDLPKGSGRLGKGAGSVAGVSRRTASSNKKLLIEYRLVKADSKDVKKLVSDGNILTDEKLNSFSGKGKTLQTFNMLVYDGMETSVSTKALESPGGLGQHPSFDFSGTMSSHLLPDEKSVLLELTLELEKQGLDDKNDKVITKREVASSAIVPDGGTIFFSLDEKLFLLVKAVVVKDEAEEPKTQVSIESRFIVVGADVLESLDEPAFQKDTGKIKDPYFKPEVSCEFFEGSKPMDDEKAAEFVQGMNDDINIYYLDENKMNLFRAIIGNHICATTLTSPKIVVNDGESGALSISTEMRYYDSKIDDAGNLKSIIVTFDKGLNMGVEPLVLKDGKRIDLKIDIGINDVQGFIKDKHKSGKTFDVPVWQKTELKARLEIPEGKTLMITGWKTIGTFTESDNKDATECLEVKDLIILVKPAVIEAVEAEGKTVQAAQE